MSVCKLQDEWLTVYTLTRRRVQWRLIWVYTICVSLSVRIRRIRTVKLIKSNPLINHRRSAPAKKYLLFLGANAAL